MRNGGKPPPSFGTLKVGAPNTNRRGRKTGKSRRRGFKLKVESDQRSIYLKKMESVVRRAQSNNRTKFPDLQPKPTQNRCALA